MQILRNCKLYFIASVLFFVLLTAACEKEKAKSLKITVGDLVPTLQLRTIDGKPTQLNFSGDKITLLNIWATWCGPCRHEMPSLQRLADKLASDKYQVIGLSVDSDQHVAREYLNDKNIKFKNFIDTDMHIANNIFGLRAYPSTFILDKQGRVTYLEETWRFWDEAEGIRLLTR